MRDALFTVRNTPPDCLCHTGEGLPDTFFSRISDFSSSQLLLVLGTSLSVGPFNTLMHRVPPHCPRVLVNLESVGEADRPGGQGFEFDRPGTRDVRFLGEADDGVEELCALLGWGEELRRLREEGWREIEEAEGKGEAEDGAEGGEVPAPAKEESVAVEDKQEEVIERVGEAAGGKKEQERETAEADKEVDALTEAVEGVSLDGQEAEVDSKKQSAL